MMLQQVLLFITVLVDFCATRPIHCTFIQHDTSTYYCYDRQGLGRRIIKFFFKPYTILICRHVRGHILRLHDTNP